ncbi:MAG: secretin N-terminal domain-containing protein [Gammaproteobacteria bacterium]
MPPKQPTAEETEHLAKQAAKAPKSAREMQVEAGPSTLRSMTKVVKLEKSRESVNLKGAPMTVNLNEVSLPVFINEIFGNLLGMSFEIDKNISGLSDIVNLRITKPEPPGEIYRIATAILKNYGIVAQRGDKVTRFVLDVTQAESAKEPPLLVSGRALPSVPLSHHPVFQVVPLYYVKNTDIHLWIQNIFDDPNLKVLPDSKQNSIILRGSAERVAQAVEAIKLMDRPNMRGQYSALIRPAFQPPRELAKSLIDALKAEGFAASSNPDDGSIIILPVDSINVILAFAGEEALLEHIREWAEDLDMLTETSETEELHYYPVKNTRATEIAKTLGNILPGMVQASTPVHQAGGDAARGAKSLSSSAVMAGSKLVVDEANNALLYYGTDANWVRIVPTIQKMDVPSKQVLIEVTLAEITLNDDEELGLEWFINADIDNYAATWSTIGLLGDAAGAPFAFSLLNSAGKTKLFLHALASNKRVNIVSSPSVMVKNGGEASLEVGTEVPLISSTTVSGQQTEGTTNQIQNIQYRKTGVLLNVKPTVHSGRRIDLDVSQELSAAQPNSTGGTESPEILNRSIKTTLNLEDGGSVLLGGLIQDDVTDGNSGVPYLKDLPWLGYLFSNRSKSKQRTELIVLLIPYIVDDDQKASEITEAFRKKLHVDKHARTATETIVPD